MLFNQFIWDLHQRLLAACPGVGVPIGPCSTPAPPLVTDLTYADNVLLCSSTPRWLQRLIDCFCACCSEEGLIVNPTKCVKL
jgi:hypothetical protein